ncbi:MAG: hypothetical protein HY980_04305 [Candidatus Magasanikbacteria bacterium]|nr:hypothetical protein [Candidatus Magasanikbacteria bacterium]
MKAQIPELCEGQIRHILTTDIATLRAKGELPMKFSIAGGQIVFEAIQPIPGRPEIYPAEKLKDWPENTVPAGPIVNDPTVGVAVLRFVAKQSDQLLGAVELGSAGSWGYLFTIPRGIANLVANVVGNPNIRYIILLGHDSAHRAGQALLSLHANGLSKEGEIRGADNSVSRLSVLWPLVNPDDPHYLEIDGENPLKRLQRQVTLVDLMGVRELTPEAAGLVIRAAIQGPKSPWKVTVKNKEYVLCHKGAVRTKDNAEIAEPFHIQLPGHDTAKKKNSKVEIWGGSRHTGTSFYYKGDGWRFVDADLTSVAGEDGHFEDEYLVLSSPQLILYGAGNITAPPGWYAKHRGLLDEQTANKYLQSYGLSYVVPGVMPDHKGKLQMLKSVRQTTYGGLDVVAKGWRDTDDEDMARMTRIVERWLYPHGQPRKRFNEWRNLTSLYKKLEQFGCYNQLVETVKSALQAKSAGSSTIQVGQATDHWVKIEWYWQEVWKFDLTYFRAFQDLEVLPDNITGAIMIACIFSKATNFNLGIIRYTCEKLGVSADFLPRKTIQARCPL